MDFGRNKPKTKKEGEEEEEEERGGKELGKVQGPFIKAWFLLAAWTLLLLSLVEVVAAARQPCAKQLRVIEARHSST